MAALLRTRQGVEVHEELGVATEWRTYRPRCWRMPVAWLLWLRRVTRAGTSTRGTASAWRSSVWPVVTPVMQTSTLRGTSSGLDWPVRQRELPEKKLAASAVREATREIP